MSTKVYGIDVSYHQGVIDWQKTASELRRVNGGKNPGFAFLRVGRSNLDGKGGLSLDSQWKNNLAGCEANGVPVGVYWYCYDESVAAVMQTAHDVVDQLKGHKFDYPIVFDMEYEPFNTGEETSDPDKKRPIEEVRATNTAMIQAALEVLEHEGYYAVLYCSRDFFLNYTDLSELTDYDKWEAAYTSSDTEVVENGIWQYSSKNALRIAGFGNKLDCDVAYKDYPSIIRKAGLNGYGK